MHDLARRVERAAALALVFGDQVFKDLAEHLGVNGHFFIERLIFAHGEIVQIENRENIFKDFIVQQDIRAVPGIALERLKQPAVQERDPAFKPGEVMILRLPFGRERVIEKMLQHVIEKVMVIFGPVKPLQEVSGAGSPFRAARYAQPALFLQEV